MTALFKPTGCPVSPHSLKNDLLHFTSPLLGQERPEPSHHVAYIHRQYPTSKNMLLLVSSCLHVTTPSLSRTVITFSLPDLSR